MKNQPPHVVRWLRAVLDLSQQELSCLIGSGESTIRAIESGRLPLSAKFAYRLSNQTGLQPKWFLQNKLGDPLPDPIAVRQHFTEAQKGLPPPAERKGYLQGNLPSLYEATLIPRTILLRHYILQRLVVNELGYAGCRHTGIFDLLMKMNLQLLKRVPNSKTRRRLLQESNDLVAQGVEKVVNVAMGDCHEILSGVRENKGRKKARKAKPNR